MARCGPPPTDRVPHELLGTMSDLALSKLCGCAESTVAKHRRDEGIRPWGDTPRPRPVDAWIGKLGTMTDPALSALSGIPVSTLHGERKRRGIDAFGSRPPRREGAEFGQQRDAARDVLAQLRKGSGRPCTSGE